MTLNRFCGSGQQAITVAAMGVASGAQDLVVAGGVESMSRWNLTAGSVDHRRRQPRPSAMYPTVPQGISADLIATLEGFTREDVDAFAVESQRRAAAAISEGRFDRTVIAVTDADGDVRAGPRRASACRHDAATGWRSCVPHSPPWCHATRTARRAATTRSASSATRHRPHRPRPPRRQLLRRRRRCGGGARRLGRLGAGARRHAARPDPRRPRRSAPSRSSC